jgi:CheY-like chemotaxis protein
MQSAEPVRIVLVEDNVGDVTILKHGLDECQRAYSLDVLEDGEQALQFVKSWPNRVADAASWVLVLDVHLPKHDGAEVLQAVRAHPELSQVRVVVLSGLANPKEAATLRKSGADLYRQKPSTWADVKQLAGEILAIARVQAVSTSK